MRISRKRLRKLIKEEINILLEEEGEEEAAEEEGGEEAAEAEGGEEAAEEAEEKPDVTPAEEATLSKSADDQILAHIIDFETNAIKSATVARDDQLRPDPQREPIDIELESKWYKNSLKNMLFEEIGEETDGPNLHGQAWVGSPDIDIAIFSSDVARLIMNYDSLIDMEALIINKAESYLIDKYDVDTAEYFLELMDIEHDMRTSDPEGLDRENEDVTPPVAVGAGFASQPGGGA